MIKICVRIEENGKTYLAKDFLNRFNLEAVNIYGFHIVEIDEEYLDCVSDDFDGLNFNIDKYKQRKIKEENQNKIQHNLQRMEELSKDFIQAYLGASIPNIDVKKQEFARLHNEVRNLQGKEPRIYYLT